MRPKSLLIIIILVLLSASCYRRERPIKIGFVGTLIGRYSDISIDCRNGVMLAADEINKNGGVNSIPIELVIKDDRMESDKVVKVHQELDRSGVKVVIGHITSAMSMTALPEINRLKMLMISPTTSASIFSGLDDYFMRVQPCNEYSQQILAQYIYDNYRLEEISIIYDLSNQDFAEEWAVNFSKEFQKLGGGTSSIIKFCSGPSVNMSKIAQQVIGSNSGGLLIVANSNDTANLCQQIRKHNRKILLFTTDWAISGSILEYGGTSIEGLTFPQIFDREYSGELYQQFVKKYTEQYGTEPSFAALMGYETMQVIFKAMLNLKEISSDNLKKEIIKQRKFNGLQGNFQIDKYGDAYRYHKLFTIRDGKFKRIDMINEMLEN